MTHTVTPKLFKLGGFTLVELSIVLVILGLLVGGVLSGQSLIHAAQLRAVTTEEAQYATAVQTFKGKYLALPGDMTNAYSFWPSNCSGAYTTAASNSTPASGNANACNGNGDGKISWAEGPQLWQDLQLAGLTNATVTADCSAISKTATIQYYGFTGSDVQVVICSNIPGVTIPASKMPNTGWTIYYSKARQANVLQISSGPTTGYQNIGRGAGLKPEDAYSIDVKMDDGIPNTGSVDAQKTNPNGPCWTGSSYNLQTTTPVCPLFIKLGA